MRLAAASADGVAISEHFGRAPVFCIIDIDEESWTWKMAEQRENPLARRCGGHDVDLFEKSVDLLGDCGAVFAAKFGPHAKAAIERRGIQALEVSGPIGDVTGKYIAYLKKKRAFGSRAEL